MSQSGSLTFTQEEHFHAAMQGPIAECWASRKEGYLAGHGTTQLYWVSITKPGNTKAIVMVNGRTETVLKYQELFFDLREQGYDVYSFDHRGQGMSERIAPDPHMGHIESFDDYVADLHTIIEHFDLGSYSQRYLLGHSMGGAVTTRYLQTHDAAQFNAVALCAPMFGINLPPLFKPFARGLSRWVSALSANIKYAIGQSGYSPSQFEGNALTHSEVRFRWGDELHQATEKVQMGGPTYRWVWQAIDAAKQCVKHAVDIKRPMLIVQAASDTVVDNRAHQRFIDNALPSQRFVSVEGARHELLLEKDSMRNQALNHIIQWFEKHK